MSFNWNSPVYESGIVVDGAIIKQVRQKPPKEHPNKHADNCEVAD